MVLEATILVVDNSEHSRNGDYLPSRFEAQSDAVNLIFSAKTNSNPESSVGLMTMGGSQPEVLTTLTNDFGKIIEGLHRTKIRGNAHLSTALNVAQLALKHRQNKSQHQRIIVFTCSPLSEDEKTIVKLAKRMKKNNIHVDIVAFGDLDEDNVKKVEAFHENIKSSAGAGAEGSNLAIIPPGPNLLSDSIVASDILAGDGMGGGGVGMGGGGGGGGGGGESGGGASGGASGGGGDAGFGDVDPNMDPDLAMALRLSMEEEERRIQREQQEREGKTTLDTVPEGEEKSGEASSSGAADKKDDSDKKDGDQDKMDTA